MIQEKLDAAKRVIEEHNALIEESHRIDAEAVIRKIKLAGGTSPDRLRSFTYEDILVLLPVTEGVKPVGLAKDIAKEFRYGVANVTTGTATYVSPKRAEMMSAAELVEHYDLRDPTNAVGKRLKELSNGLPFIVLDDDDNKVIISGTVTLLDEIRNGFGSRDVYETGGKYYTTLKVGERPEQLADEDPLYPGRPLRPDGYSDQLNRSWEGVPYETRALLRLAILEGELKVTQETAHSALDLAIQPNGLQKIRQRYAKAAALYAAKDKSHDLPKLRVPLTTHKPTSILSQGTTVSRR